MGSAPVLCHAEAWQRRVACTPVRLGLSASRRNHLQLFSNRHAGQRPQDKASEFVEKGAETKLCLCENVNRMEPTRDAATTLVAAVADRGHCFGRHRSQRRVEQFPSVINVVARHGDRTPWLQRCSRLAPSRRFFRIVEAAPSDSKKDSPAVLIVYLVAGTV